MYGFNQTKSVFAVVCIFAAVICVSCSAGESCKKSHPSIFFDVYNYGAKGDGTTLDTKSIQAAIDDCTAKGGGRVYLHNGTFLSGTIFLKDNVVLDIEAGTTLLGSKNLEDYPETIPDHRSYTDNYTVRSLVYAEKKKNIGIVGLGKIDGQGEFLWDAKSDKDRPYLMRIIECQRVTVRDITLENAAMWIQHYLACEDVLVDGVRVNSPDGRNNDGIDVDSCTNVRVSNCTIDSHDDAIVLKSSSNRPCKDVTITNCILSTVCNAIKTGTESNGGFQNISISNCIITKAWIAGIALELVDGGRFDDVSVSNITMKEVGAAIFVRLGNRARPFKEGQSPAMGSMQNVVISDVRAAVLDNIGSSITGLEDYPIRNVTLRNIFIDYKEYRKIDQVLGDVPELSEEYPDAKMFGILPSYGFFCRHVENLRIDNVQIRLEPGEKRPALIFDDIKGLDISSLEAESAPETSAVMRLKNVDGAFIHDCRSEEIDIPFMHVAGEKSNGITVMNNDFSGVKCILEKDKDVKNTAVTLLYHHKEN